MIVQTATALLAHQVAAVEKLMPTRVGGLFMEMGTGKSRTAIELVARRQERVSKAVWFCPVSLRETVRQEILKHTAAAADDIHVLGDRTLPGRLPEAPWHVVGIESMSSSDRVTCIVNHLVDEGTFAIVDESSYIKGPYSRRTMRITHICERARYRLALTGTPLSQGVEDLYAQMRFLSPQILGYRSWYSFAANHLEYSTKFPGMIARRHNVAYLAAKIAPYVYQVTKDECLDLPEKLYERRWVRMSVAQRDAYEQAKQELLAEIDLDTVDSYAIFRLFNALQQIVCGFWRRRAKPGDEPDLVELAHDRLEVLGATVAGLRDERVVIWAKYQHDIQAICERLRTDYGAEAIAEFHGAVPPARRKLELERFRAGARFLVATQDCGGYGLNLQDCAHHAIYYANSFKYSARQQSEDRLHRIGQEHKVCYIDLVCTGSIDERIQQALGAKGDAVALFKHEVEKVKGSRDAKDRLHALVEGL